MKPVGAAVIVLVDARNVLRSEWPNIPERQLVALCRAWAETVGVHAVVAFDGQAPDGLVGKERLDQHASLVGTGDESADDWIVRAAQKLAAAGRPYRLVTSDRALRAAAGGRADDLVGGGTFARILRSVESGATSGPSGPSTRAARAGQA
jgi:predicted RNA-binding protein with PIN domain